MSATAATWRACPWEALAGWYPPPELFAPKRIRSSAVIRVAAPTLLS
jgi:hypothetical protein